jgi:hypothetical protein
MFRGYQHLVNFDFKHARKETRKYACTFDTGRLLVVIDNIVHHVHHGFSGTEHGDDGVEPGIALIEVVRHLMPTAIVLHAQILHILPIAREP